MFFKKKKPKFEETLKDVFDELLELHCLIAEIEAELLIIKKLLKDVYK